MSYDIVETPVIPCALAGVRARVPTGRVPEFFGQALHQVYAASVTGAIAVDGQNVFLYQPGPDGDLDVAFSVGTFAPFEQVGTVEFLQTSSGVAATTTHWGNYSGLRDAHDALQAWCKPLRDQVQITRTAIRRPGKGESRSCYSWRGPHLRQSLSPQSWRLHECCAFVG